MLTSMVNARRIRLNQKALDKTEAIREIGELLLRDQYIEKSYIDAMIEMSETLNSYIVIAPGIAMPHARPERGAKKSGFAIMTLNPPIPFGHSKNDPVRLMIALSATDNNSHIEALSELSRFLDDASNIDALCRAETADEVMNLLQTYEDKRKNAGNKEDVT